MSPARAAAGSYQEGSCTRSETAVRSSVDDAVGGSRFAYGVTARRRSPHIQEAARTGELRQVVSEKIQIALLKR